MYSRIGVHDFTFEACSGFTRVTACRVAQPPQVAFVTRLRLEPLPNQAACQLPDLPTTICVGLPPTGDLRSWGALHIPGYSATMQFRSFVLNNIPGYTFILAIIFPLHDSLQVELVTGLILSAWISGKGRSNSSISR